MSVSQSCVTISVAIAIAYSNCETLDVEYTVRNGCENATAAHAYSTNIQ